MALGFILVDVASKMTNGVFPAQNASDTALNKRSIMMSVLMCLKTYGRSKR